eukprot:7745060-Heterocapsa_arctica.AAC.1
MPKDHRVGLQARPAVLRHRGREVLLEEHRETRLLCRRRAQQHSPAGRQTGVQERRLDVAKDRYPVLAVLVLLNEQGDERSRSH